VRIGIVGGVERSESRFKTVAIQAGHHVEFHAGHMSGPGSDRLKAMMDRCDLVVIVTEVNSHAAVLHARALARRSGRPVLYLRKLGTSQLRALLN
jgi:predicted dehydrogenase